jgi:ribosomal 50S subunit-recycling heat shock protein
MRKTFSYLALQGIRMITTSALVSMLSISLVQAQEVKGATVVASVSATATVTSINQTTREVTVKTEDGVEHSFVASKDVKNLAQVKKGDIITVKYTEALAYQVRKHGEASGVSTTQAAASAAPGAKPAATVAQQTSVTVTITAIDPTIPTVTFTGPKGNSKTIKVQDPQKLVGVKVGDLVDLTYTEEIAIKVDPAPKK